MHPTSYLTSTQGRARKGGTRDLGSGAALHWTFICLLGHTTLESGYMALLVRTFEHTVQKSGDAPTYLTSRGQRGLALLGHIL